MVTGLQKEAHPAVRLPDQRYFADCMPLYRRWTRHLHHFGPANEIRRLARSADNIKILTLCGGSIMRTQTSSLEHGAHIVVGTPGRIMDHMEIGRAHV